MGPAKIDASAAYDFVCVKLNVRRKRTNTQTDEDTRPYLRFPLCLSGASILWMDEARRFIEI